VLNLSFGKTGPKAPRSILAIPPRRNVWRPLGPPGISPIAVSKGEAMLLPIHEPRKVESTLEDRHRVTARGHLRE
jgi:hypothetical protein